jgi:hypothetical protein
VSIEESVLECRLQHSRGLSHPRLWCYDRTQPFGRCSLGRVIYPLDPNRLQCLMSRPNGRLERHRHLCTLHEFPIRDCGLDERDLEGPEGK